MGVMRQIGSGLRAAGSISPCIGFAPLNALSDDIRHGAVGAKQPPKVNKKTALEAHHSHFLLCHDQQSQAEQAVEPACGPGTLHRRASRVSEIANMSRTHLEIRRSVEEYLQSRYKVPRLVVVVGGENDVLNEICDALKVNTRPIAPLYCTTTSQSAPTTNPWPAMLVSSRISALWTAAHSHSPRFRSTRPWSS